MCMVLFPPRFFTKILFSFASSLQLCCFETRKNGAHELFFLRRFFTQNYVCIFCSLRKCCFAEKIEISQIVFLKSVENSHNEKVAMKFFREFARATLPFFIDMYNAEMKVKVGNGQEMVQSERNSHFKNQVGKTKLTIRYSY